MATSEQYDRAIARVKAGGGDRQDLRLTEKAAQQAGSRGNSARAALRGR